MQTKSSRRHGDGNAVVAARHLGTLGADAVFFLTSDIKHLCSYFNDAPLDQLEPEHVEKFKRRPTTANRCIRRFSTSMWNDARAWGYTKRPNPRTGIKGYKLKKRLHYVTDEVFDLVPSVASEPLKDALDLGYLDKPSEFLPATSSRSGLAPPPASARARYPRRPQTGRCVCATCGPPAGMAMLRWSRSVALSAR
jgi:hypothetical protein